MSAITKEWLQQKIADMEATRDEIPFGLDEDDSNTLAAMKLALASLEAEAVAWLVKFEQIGHSSNNFTKTYFDKGEKDRWVDLHKKSGFNVDVTPLHSAPPATVSVPDDIDTRMKNAGMLSASEIIAGQPIDAFMKHAGVVDLESLLKWAEMRRAEFLRMQAKYELGDNQKDDMYEWVISHVAAFSELHVNIRAAMLQGAENAESLTGIKAAPDLDFVAKNTDSLTGNHSVIPDGWVACSERMPEEDTYNVVADIGSEGNIYCAAATWFIHGNFSPMDGISASNYDGGASIEINMHISHWMPLPTPPQK